MRQIHTNLKKVSIHNLCWPQWHGFLLGMLHTKCSPTCLSGEHNSVFTDYPLYTSHSTLFKSFFQQDGEGVSLFLFLQFFHSCCPLHTSSRTSRKFTSWIKLVGTTNKSFFWCQMTILCMLSWSFVVVLVSLSLHSHSVLGPHVRYFIYSSSET